jgi:Family of unknown function (DUF5993)
MMAALYLIFVIDMVLLFEGYRKTAIILTLINLLLCLAMFWHHVTDKLTILL